LQEKIVQIVSIQFLVETPKYRKKSMCFYDFFKFNSHNLMHSLIRQTNYFHNKKKYKYIWERKKKCIILKKIKILSQLRYHWCLQFLIILASPFHSTELDVYLNRRKKIVLWNRIYNFAIYKLIFGSRCCITNIFFCIDYFCFCTKWAFHKGFSLWINMKKEPRFY
jgi:hypothetical protein